MGNNVTKLFAKFLLLYPPVLSHAQGYCKFVCLTLDAPLEKGLAPLTWPDAVVVAWGVVLTHGAVVKVRLPAGRHHTLLTLLRTSPCMFTDRLLQIELLFLVNWSGLCMQMSLIKCMFHFNKYHISYVITLCFGMLQLRHQENNFNMNATVKIF